MEKHYLYESVHSIRNRLAKLFANRIFHQDQAKILLRNGCSLTQTLMISSMATSAAAALHCSFRLQQQSPLPLRRLIGVFVGREHVSRCGGLNSQPLIASSHVVHPRKKAGKGLERINGHGALALRPLGKSVCLNAATAVPGLVTDDDTISISLIVLST
jgi:hypothetical protein